MKKGLTSKQMSALHMRLRLSGKSYREARHIVAIAKRLSKSYGNKKLFPGKMKGSLAYIDFDGDGKVNRWDCYPFDKRRQDDITHKDPYDVLRRAELGEIIISEQEKKELQEKLAEKPYMSLPGTIPAMEKAATEEYTLKELEPGKITNKKELRRKALTALRSNEKDQLPKTAKIHSVKKEGRSEEHKWRRENPVREAMAADKRILDLPDRNDTLAMMKRMKIDREQRDNDRKMKDHLDGLKRQELREHKLQQIARYGTWRTLPQDGRKHITVLKKNTHSDKIHDQTEFKHTRLGRMVVEKKILEQLAKRQLKQPARLLVPTINFAQPPRKKPSRNTQWFSGKYGADSG